MCFSTQQYLEPILNFGPLTMDDKKSKIAATTRLFSSAVFNELAKKGRSSTFARLVHEIGCEQFDALGSVAEAFDAAFEIISKPGNRDEYVYKSAIAQKVLLGRHSLKTASMLTEVRVNGNKADVVILNGTSTVYEIKSERDNLSRLPEQLASYLQAFANVNVITSADHIDGVAKVAPKDVGILVLNQRGQISEVRKAIQREERINPSILFDTLRVQEASDILTLLNIDVPKVPNTERFRTVKQLFENQNPVLLHKASVLVLKKTRAQIRLKDFVFKLPYSLQTSALSTPIRQRDQVRVIDSLKLPLFEAIRWI